MKPASFCPLLASALLLVLTACASPRLGAAPPPGAALVAVDLGGSSRISQIAGLPGEGEGYATAQAEGLSTAHTSMAGMSHETGMPKAPAPMSGMDHGAMVDASRSAGNATPTAHASRAHLQGTGTVNSVDSVGHKVNLSHGAIAALGWPAMTMDFAVAPSIDLQAIKPGTCVSFMMEQSNDGAYVIHSLAPAAGGP